MKYRMKVSPVVDAFQFTGDVEALKEWLLDVVGASVAVSATGSGVSVFYQLTTTRLSAGWWLIHDRETPYLHTLLDAEFRADFEEAQP